MKVFISSVISGMEKYRKAAKSAIKSLGYDPICAEDFTASPSSARVACMEGVRLADAMVILLGERYGEIQNSGISATHEEYMEALDHCPVFTFILSDSKWDENQKKFISEIQQYNTGHYTNTFCDENDLRDSIVKSLHQWELSQIQGSLNPQELLDKTLSFLSYGQRIMQFNRPALWLAMGGGPLQSILRPSKLEDSDFIEDLTKMAIYGEEAVFTRKEGTRDRQEDHFLLLEQDSAALMLNEQGSLLLQQNLINDTSFLPTIIQEDILKKMIKGLNFLMKILNEIDPTEHLSHISIVLSINEVGHFAWRTQREAQENPNTVSFGFQQKGEKIVHLSPPYRKRSSLKIQIPEIAEDLVVLLRRQFR